MSDCSVYLLGGPTLRDATGTIDGAAARRHPLALLAVLAIAQPRAVSRDRLIALLWPERDARRGRALLSVAVHALRRALGADALRGTGDALLLDAERVSVDVARFERAWSAGDAEGAVEAYAGPFLDGFHLPDAPEFEQWADAERSRLASSFGRALARAARRRAEAGDRAGAIALWLRLGAHDPYGGATALRVIEALAALGDRPAALEHARRHAERLRAEFDASPDESVLAAAARLREAPAVTRTRVREAGDRAEADALCLRGRHLWTQRSPEQLRRAITYFERALAAAPGHAGAYAGLADAWSMLGFYSHLPPRSSFGRARGAARRAVESDPGAPEAYASLAYVRMYYDWRWDRAERGFRRALRLDETSAKSHQWLGNLLALRGRHDEAIARMRRVRALQPLSPIANAVPGWACLHAGRYDEATDHLREALELDPHFAVAWLWLGQVELARGRPTDAIAAFHRAEPTLGGSTTLELALAQGEAAAGARETAAERVDRLLVAREAGRYVPACDLAKAELALGRTGRALGELRRARDERDHALAFLLVDPGLAAVRETSAARELAGELGLV